MLGRPVERRAVLDGDLRVRDHVPDDRGYLAHGSKLAPNVVDGLTEPGGVGEHCRSERARRVTDGEPADRAVGWRDAYGFTPSRFLEQLSELHAVTGSRSEDPGRPERDDREAVLGGVLPAESLREELRRGVGALGSQYRLLGHPFRVVRRIGGVDRLAGGEDDPLDLGSPGDFERAPWPARVHPRPLAGPSVCTEYRREVDDPIDPVLADRPFERVRFGHVAADDRVTGLVAPFRGSGVERDRFVSLRLQLLTECRSDEPATTGDEYVHGPFCTGYRDKPTRDEAGHPRGFTQGFVGGPLTPGVNADSTAVPRETTVVVGLVSGSHVINHTYLVLFPPILGVLAVEFDVGLAALGVAMGVQAFVNTAFQLPFGYLADTYDRTLALELCLGLGALGAFVLALAPTFEWLLVGQAILGVGIAGHHPAHFPLIADSTPERLRGRAFSVHGFAGNVGFGAAPLLIVAVMGLGHSWRVAFALLGLFGLAYAFLAFVVLTRFVDPSIRVPERGGSQEGTPIQRVRSGVRAVFEAPGILALGLFALVGSTAGWGITSFVVTLLEEGYGVAPNVASLTLSAMFGAGALLMLAGGDLSDRFSPGPVIVGSYGLLVVFVLALSSLAVPPPVAIGAAILAGSVTSLAIPARDTLADALSQRADLGRNFAIITIGIMVGSTIAPPLFGFVIETAGFRVAFTSIAGVAALGVLITAWIVRTWGDGHGSESGVPSD